MEPDNLDWDRKKWGCSRVKRYSFESEKKKTNNNGINAEIDYTSPDWRLNYRVNRVNKHNAGFKILKFNDDEKFWSRGGEVVLVEAENLLNKMSKDDYVGNISKNLLEPKLKISELLNNEKRFDVNLSQTLMKVILKESEDNLFEKDFRQFLILLMGTNFVTKRMDSLINVDLVKEPTTELLEEIVRFLKLSFEAVPGLAYDVLYPRLENLHVLMSGRLVELDVSRNMLSELDELRIVAVANCPYRCEGVGSTLSDYVEPPGSFRDMSVFPTRRDLLESDTVNVFLRENKSLGAYRSVDHYLDVQFRLMREDLVRPLREGVKTMRSNVSKSSTVRVYRHVTVETALPDRKLGIVHRVQFDGAPLVNVNWAQSKRMMHGALLCFFNHHWDHFLLAVVAKRSDSDLARGSVTVKFVDEVGQQCKEYLILESTNLFENYRHVLTRLQSMRDDGVAMSRYVVYGERDVAVPQYLVNNPHILDIMDTLECDDEGRLDQGQREAVKMALTKEIAIIQGPPGTGKSRVALEICRHLMTHVQRSVDGFGPILVVCYSNHVLDQFLEAVSTLTRDIVRIGGGCKSEVVSEFSIQDCRRPLEDPVVAQMEALEVELNWRRSALQGLINLERLGHVMSREHYEYFVRLRLEKWLRGEEMEPCISTPTQSRCDELVQDIIGDEMRMSVRTIVVEACQERGNEDSAWEETPGGWAHLTVFGAKSNTDQVLFKSFLRKQTKMSAMEVAKVESVESLSLMDRWRLYRYWRSVYVADMRASSKEKEEEYEMLSGRLNELLAKQDEEMMARQSIIGMTTTGAAKYGPVLERLRCKVVIVEEAAEVMESHVIGAMSGGCEHMILIGDHQQLRPSPAVYELASKYGLGLSLFERLVGNGLPYERLCIQYRMRPQIADMLRLVYDQLEDHESVSQYLDVSLLASNVFFFNHCHPETRDEDSASYMNEFEAQMVVRLCRHLLGNGVAGERITILTLYSGQHWLMQSLTKDPMFHAVTVAVVDNYQGQENDIILLSLVRSNDTHQIGFVGVENRIIVSLSRAKHGLYAFGNFDLLSRNNPTWERICEHIRGRGYMNTEMVMSCHNHRHTRLVIRGPEDFDKYPDYGCEERCGRELRCGHRCGRYCHYLDEDHVSYQCMDQCTRTCISGHRCVRKCHEECGECEESVEKIVPECGHRQVMPCSGVPDRSVCENRCERILPCKHRCVRKCHEECGECVTMVYKRSVRCGHKGLYQCHVTVTSCNHLCDYVMRCGHECQGVCGVCWCTGVHGMLCDVKCDEVILCGHPWRAKYTMYEWPGLGGTQDQCTHRSHHLPCTNDRCNKCAGHCQWKCPHKKCSQTCEEMCDREWCDEPCDLFLFCSECDKRFRCYSVCGEQCRMVCRVCDGDIVEGALYVTLWTCGHRFEVKYMDQYMTNEPWPREMCHQGCPTCGVIITRRSCFRYMNMIRERAQDIEQVQRVINTRIESLEYSSYYRILLRVRRVIFPLFRYYDVSMNYFLTTGDGTFVEGEDALYKEYYHAKMSHRHILVYKYRCSLLLLYRIYTGIQVFVLARASWSDDYHDAITSLIEWLNPHHRTYNDLDMETFVRQYNAIRHVLGKDVMTIQSSQLISGDSGDYIGDEDDTSGDMSENEVTCDDIGGGECLIEVREGNSEEILRDIEDKDEERILEGRERMTREELIKMKGDGEKVVKEEERCRSVDSEADMDNCTRANNGSSVLSDECKAHFESLFKCGYTYMRTFISRDRRWYKCVNGHFYHIGECFQVPYRCPQCYPNVQWPERLITD